VKPDGAACSDGDACTQTDTCQGGACSGVDPVVCTALDQCHDVGTCDTVTGTCSNPPKPNGATCDDGDACTQTDTCQSGLCSGNNPVVCTPPDGCHDAGTCDPETGTCSTPSRPDGSTCDDGNPCSLNDVCTGGSCGGGPACGDGVVQGGCGEVCDDGAANGTNQCCSASCALVDGDDDGLCDAIDPCTGGVALTRALVMMSRQTTPPGDDMLSWRGELLLPFPFTPGLDPATKGVRILLAQGSSVLLDVTIPGGPLVGTPPVGWKVSGNGTRWQWSNRNPTPAAPLSKVQVQRVASTPGRVKVRVQGKYASLQPAPGNPPVGAVFVLDPSGQCGEASLACTFNGTGTSRRCR
jgi:hypothetical protein